MRPAGPRESPTLLNLLCKYPLVQPLPFVVATKKDTLHMPGSLQDAETLNSGVPYCLSRQLQVTSLPHTLPGGQQGCFIFNFLLVWEPTDNPSLSVKMLFRYLIIPLLSKCPFFPERLMVLVYCVCLGHSCRLLKKNMGMIVINEGSLDVSDFVLQCLLLFFFFLYQISVETLHWHKVKR